MVPRDLLLDLGLVLLQVSKALLQVQILLALVCDSGVVDLGNVLQLGDEVRHVVRVHRVELVPHALDLHPVLLDLLLVVLELVVGVLQHALQILHVKLHRVCVRAWRSVPCAIWSTGRVVLLVSSCN